MAQCRSSLNIRTIECVLADVTRFASSTLRPSPGSPPRICSSARARRRARIRLRDRHACLYVRRVREMHKARDSEGEDILSAVATGVEVVVGTSGFTDEDFADIDAVARRQHRGVLDAGTSRGPWYGCRFRRDSGERHSPVGDRGLCHDDEKECAERHLSSAINPRGCIPTPILTSCPSGRRMQSRSPTTRVGSRDHGPVPSSHCCPDDSGSLW